MGWMAGVHLLVGVMKEFFTLPPCPNWFWGPPSLFSGGYWGSFPGGKMARV